MFSFCSHSWLKNYDIKVWLRFTRGDRARAFWAQLELKLSKLCLSWPWAQVFNWALDAFSTIKNYRALFCRLRSWPRSFGSSLQAYEPTSLRVLGCSSPNSSNGNWPEWNGLRMEMGESIFGVGLNRLPAIIGNLSPTPSPRRSWANSRLLKSGSVRKSLHWTGSWAEEVKPLDQGIVL